MAPCGTAINGMAVNANTAQLELAVGSTAHTRPYRLAVGLGVSLALHAALLTAWRHHQIAGSAPDDEPVSRTIAVWLRPPPPPPEPKPEPEPARSRAVAKARNPASAVAKSKPARSSELIAIPDPSPGEAEPPDVFSVEPLKEAAEGKRFDRDAALRVARGVGAVLIVAAIFTGMRGWQTL